MFPTLCIPKPSLPKEAVRAGVEFGGRSGVIALSHEEHHFSGWEDGLVGKVLATQA